MSDSSYGPLLTFLRQVRFNAREADLLVTNPPLLAEKLRTDIIEGRLAGMNAEFQIDRIKLELREKE